MSGLYLPLVARYLQKPGIKTKSTVTLGIRLAKAWR